MQSRNRRIPRQRRRGAVARPRHKTYKVHMSATAERAREIVYAAIAAVNEELPGRNRIEADDLMPLAGPDGELDSLRLINLVVHVEDGIERDLGLQVSLTDSPNLFDAGGPLATAGGVIDHVMALIDSEAA